MERAARAAFRAHATTYGAVNGGLTGLWAITGGGDFWPAWVAAPWAMGLGAHYMAWRALRERLRARRGQLPSGSRRLPKIR
jgi:ammonia channel protein AmtB